MFKINYPTNIVDLSSFEDDYFNFLNSVDSVKIDKHLIKIPFVKRKLSFENLVKLKFEELLEIETEIKKYSDSLDHFTTIGKKTTRSNEFADLFDYSKNQPKIASFFMKQDFLKIKTCYYCGIDYVNSFTDIDDYSDGLDFVNRANVNDLLIIKGIGISYAQKIIDHRKSKLFKTINDIGLTQSIRDQIDGFDFKNGHNHFTLDHVIPQKTHKFFSLCLYNFVPSCYGCNSKFKKAIPFEINKKLNKISPTSKNYSFSNDFKFKLFYSNSLIDIKSTSDFILHNSILRNKKHVENYISMFKITGRYVFHKDQVISLVEKKIKYPASRIKEVSMATGKSQEEIKRMIFGEELFNDTMSNEPMIKLKRDIAKKLKIKGVL